MPLRCRWGAGGHFYPPFLKFYFLINVINGGSKVVPAEKLKVTFAIILIYQVKLAFSEKSKVVSAIFP